MQPDGIVWHRTNAAKKTKREQQDRVHQNAWCSSRRGRQLTFWSGHGPLRLVQPFLTLRRRLRILLLTRTFKEHNKIISRSILIYPQEDLMTELLQDVAALVAVSSFIVVAATWIGAL